MSNNTSESANALHQQLMWTRLIAVVEEQAQALLRTAFGSVVREAGDLSAGVYDAKGRMMAQAVTGTPGHVNTMAMAVGHFLERFPLHSMQPGDVFVSNDPWLGTGHLFDYVVVTPAFIGTQAIGLLASTSHVTDVGGRGFTAEAASVFEEGTLIPHMHIRTAGELNQQLFDIIAANSRNPTEVLGDIRSLISCNDVGARRLIEMMQEFGLSSLDVLAEHIFIHSADAMRKAISNVPDGNYKSSMVIDGYEEPITLQTELVVNGDKLVLDYAGSSLASRFGINSPKCYSDAYSVFGLKCILAPDVPNNHASLSCFEIRAQAGSCVAPDRPSPVTARHVIGQMLPDAVFGCLAQAVPSEVPAESAGSIWVLAMSDAGTSQQGAKKVDDVDGTAVTTPFNVMNVGLGGVGATPYARGLSTTAFPSGVGGIPVEVTETESPLVFYRKEFLPDSAGAGHFPGGLSQTIEIGHRDQQAFLVSAATWDRFDNPPRGRNGGHNGAPGTARLGSGKKLKGKVTHTIPEGDTLVVELPGGGGFGDPGQRPAQDVIADVDSGYISQCTAQKLYRKSDTSTD